MASLIDALATKMPIANQQRAKQQKAALDFQVQQAVAATPQPAGIKQAAQQIGQAAATQQGQAAVAGAQQQVQQAGQVAGMALGQQAMQQQQQLNQQGNVLAQKGLDNEKRLSQLAGAAKQEIFDARKQFAVDQMGNKFLSERQLADYARSAGVSEQQLADYAQHAQQVTARQITALEFAQAKIDQALKQQQALGQQKADQQLIRELTEAQAALREKINKERADYANKQGMYSTGGMILGAAGGAVIGGAPGAMAGAQIGGGLGSLAASQ